MLNFGQVVLRGQSTPQTFTLTNMGDQTVYWRAHYEQQGSAPGGFAIQGGRSPNQLAPGASCVASVVFQPLATGPDHALAYYVNNGSPTNPLKIQLSETGVQ